MFLIYLYLFYGTLCNTQPFLLYKNGGMIHKKTQLKPKLMVFQIKEDIILLYAPNTAITLMNTVGCDCKTKKGIDAI